MDLTQIEEALRSVIGMLHGALPASQLEAQLGLVDSGEPGIALEILCTELHEIDASVPAEAYGLIADAGAAMRVDSRLWLQLRRE